MPILGGLLFLVYAGCVMAIIVYVLRLLGQFVQAQERVAGALETIASRLAQDKR